MDLAPSFLETADKKIHSLTETANTFNCSLTQIGEGLSVRLSRSTTDFQDFLSKNDDTPDFNFLECSNEITLDFMKKSKGKRTADID